jgi:phosphatidylserine/phosphatidylglycerophosphate/cardiolipin synthase-like enzyme
MRIRKTTGNLTVKAYAGSTGVLLTFNIPENQIEGLMGFAIEEKRDDRDWRWLRTQLEWDNLPSPKAGTQFDSNTNPIQKFRWSDYGVEPGRTYDYRIHSMYGTPGNLEARDTVAISVTTEKDIDLEANGSHRVIFNRAAASSQAFARTFPNIETTIKTAKAAGETIVLPKEARVWLSRGLEESIVEFIEHATDATWALDIAIYEYELETIISAINAAEARGVNVRLIYHAQPGDAQTDLNIKNAKHLKNKAKARITKAIFHDKFIVASKLEGDQRIAQEVLCGSTNFTINGVYYQANVVHLLIDAQIANEYLELFEEIWMTPDDPAKTRAYINQKDPMPDLAAAPIVFAGFSPRSKILDLKHFVDLIKQAENDVLFCTAFALYKTVEQALLGVANDPVLRIGVQNTASTITGIHRDRTATFTASASLSTGIEGFLKERTAGQKGNIRIHTKIVVVNFTSDNPIIISGSHNFSKNASSSNDENYLILRDSRLADCYGVEILRIYDHYRFRYRMKQNTDKTKRPSLKTTWAQRYYSDALEIRDREQFSS